MGHTPQQIEWMRSLRRNLVPDPDVVNGELAGLGIQIAENEREFDRLDKMADSGAFLRLQPLAEQQHQLRARAAKLPPLIPDAEQKQRAYLTLAALFVGPLADDVQAKRDALLSDPPSEQAELDRALQEFDEASRLRARVSVALRAVSTHPDFREPDDELRALRDEWEWRISRLDRVRLPGAKP